MRDLLDLHRQAVHEFGSRVHAITPDQWRLATPCTEWDVRALVNHLVYEQLWVPPLLGGATMEEIGDRFDGDQLGDDPVPTWDTAVDAASQALAMPGALDRTVRLSYGSAAAGEYCAQLTIDLAVHAWDLARGIGADDRLDADLAATAYRWALPQMDQLIGSGLFAPPVLVPDDADLQTRLIALCGRDPHRSPIAG